MLDQPAVELNEAVEALFERARRNVRSAPRKHHLVPASYLTRWALRNRVRVTETDSKYSYVAAPDTVARETDFYSLASDDLDDHHIPPLLIETILGELEGSAKPTIDVLLKHGPCGLDPEQALSFAMFLGFQITRGRAFRTTLMTMANAGMLLQFGGLTDADIAARIRAGGEEPTVEAVADARRSLEDWKSGRYYVGPQPAAQAGHAAELAVMLPFHLLARRWRIYHSRLPLITCDEPVVPVAAPRGDLRHEPGVAAAGALLMPLDPHHLLVMFHPDLVLDDAALYAELSPTESDQVNLFVAGHSVRWLFERPDGTRTKTLLVPRLPAEPVTTERVGDPVRTGDDMTRELVRLIGRTRWSGPIPPPSRPVDRWWAHSHGPGWHDFAYDPDQMAHALFNSIA